MSSPSPEYVAKAAADLGLPADTVTAVAAHFLTMLAERRRLVWDENGSGPYCSLCAFVPLFCHCEPAAVSRA